MTDTPPPGNNQERELSAGAATRVAVSAQERGQGTYCPRCGVVVPVERQSCQGCGHAVYHTASVVQRRGLMAGMGFIILAGILIFLQPKQYHTVPQDIFECLIILCVIGAGVAFFIAVVDMVRRGGE